ncbi:hypothetical protein KBD13_01470 [Patescibacteria group bacterium]|nr:hypothetical protein [Patescibacteria group bacterium]
MMYLIGGPPRSGKTTLAKKLSSRLRIGWVSVDILESVVREYTPKKNHPKLFPKNTLREKTGGSNDEMYERFSAREIAHAYISQGKASMKAIETFVSDCVQEGHDFVLEGHQIHPKLAQTLIERFPQDVRMVFLIKKDEQALMEGFHKNSAKRDWVLQKTKQIETFQKIAKMLSYFGTYLEKEAAKYGFAVYCTDKDFLKTISLVEKDMMRGETKITSLKIGQK